MEAVASSEGKHTLSTVLRHLLTYCSVLNTVDDTTKGLPVVGGVTSP
jgi:hypothetical protein